MRAARALGLDVGAMSGFFNKIVDEKSFADYWSKLPEEVKSVLREVAVAYRDHFASIAMGRAAESRDT